ncbi:MAG TPA: RHS repeat-associated core domain-containing protein [Agriterribacter sp.]|nr:RHS repeat-associated core domain-containing protein [Agriterribacter sp.]
MKSYCITIVGVLLLITFCHTAYAGKGCGNPSKNGLDAPCDKGDCNKRCAGDPFDPFTGNETRVIQDLQVWGSIGERPLTWMRYGNSRYVTLVNAFGNAHSWNHSYNFTMSDQAPVSTGVPPNSNGKAQLFIHYPEGGSNIFIPDPNNPSVWLPLGGVNKRLFQQGDHFYLQMADGFRYHFEKLTIGASRFHYQLQDFTDSYQNRFTLSYDVNHRLVHITEPAGRFLEITYGVVGPATVITKVASSDGRTVWYHYDVYNDGLLNWIRLINVKYGDSTSAQYTYSQSSRGARPLLEHAIDPRCTGRNVNMIFKYNIAIAGGFISEERNGVTNELIVSLQTTTDHRYVCYANGKTEHYYMPETAMGNLQEHTDGLGRKTIYEFDTEPGGNGFLKSEIDAMGRITAYERTNYGNVLKVTYPDGSKESWNRERDGLDLVLTHTDELGRVTQYVRDDRHRITKIIYPDKSNEQFTYNDFGQVLIHTFRNGKMEVNEYDGRGLKTRNTDADGKLTTYTYDGADRLASVTDARHHKNQYVYNERGLLVKRIYADNHFQTYTYDDFGNQTSLTNELGNTWTSAYDEFKRLVSAIDPVNLVTKYEYDLPNGTCGCRHDNEGPSQIISPGGKITAMEYDVEWKLLKRTEGFGTADAATTSYEYDVVGNITAMIDPRGKSWLYEYDKRNREISSSDPLGNRMHQIYDAAGNVLKIIRPDNGVTSYVYDAMNRITQTTDPKGQVVKMKYDAEGNLKELTDARGFVYRYEYDNLNRETKMIYPDGSFEAYGYDAVGNVIAYSNRSGAVRTYIYDNRDREVLSHWNDGITPDISKKYDRAGRLQMLSSVVSTLSYRYNKANQLRRETQDIAGGGGGKTVTWYYDEDGLLQRMRYPQGFELSYRYNGRNQLNLIYHTGVSGGGVVKYEYDVNGNRIKKTLKNGTVTSYAYDDANRMLTLDNKKGALSFARFDYGYDKVGRRTFVQRNGNKGDVYAYDATDQVTGVQYEVTNPHAIPANPLNTTNYEWDPAGNRTTVTNNGTDEQYSTNNLNQYTAVAGNALTYNGNGALQSFNGWTYSYDAQNRLVKAEKGSTTVSFAYDARNRCVKRVVNGAAVFLYYDNWNLIEEYDAGNALLTSYIHGAMTDEILTKTGGAGQLLYYHYDALGSVMQLTNMVGSMVEQYAYDVFGEATIKNAGGDIIAGSAFGNRFMFTGREYINALELYDYRNRMYSESLGRFLQTDPVGFDAGDYNLYRYVGNNSLNKVDPLGLDSTFDKMGNWLYTGETSRSDQPLPPKTGDQRNKKWEQQICKETNKVRTVITYEQFDGKEWKPVTKVGPWFDLD